MNFWTWFFIWVFLSFWIQCVQEPERSLSARLCTPLRRPVVHGRDGLPLGQVRPDEAQEVLAHDAPARPALQRTRECLLRRPSQLATEDKRIVAIGSETQLNYDLVPIPVPENVACEKKAGGHGAPRSAGAGARGDLDSRWLRAQRRLPGDPATRSRGCATGLQTSTFFSSSSSSTHKRGQTENHCCIHCVLRKRAEKLMRSVFFFPFLPFHAGWERRTGDEEHPTHSCLDIEEPCDVFRKCTKVRGPCLTFNDVLLPQRRSSSFYSSNKLNTLNWNAFFFTWIHHFIKHGLLFSNTFFLLQNRVSSNMLVFFFKYVLFSSFFVKVTRTWWV